MKPKSDFAKLFGYAGTFRYLTVASWVLSGLSALIALTPFIYIWKIIGEALAVAPNFTQAQNLVHNGWMAVLLSLLSMLVYCGGLMCSHIAAFRVKTNITSAAMRHIVTLPLGFLDGIGSGKLRKIINESSAATENYLAHRLPDWCGAMVTPLGLLGLLLYFDWRLGLLSLIPVAISFAIVLSMTGAKMRRQMAQYQNALETMSNEAVEYVRGVPVVKTFGQSVFSFKHFKASIDSYGKWVIAYTRQMLLPMVFYTLGINAVFAVLIAAALWMTAGGVTPDFLLNLLLYIIITPIISVTLSRIMFAGEDKMIVADALSRIDSVMELAPMAEPAAGTHPRDNSVALSKVSFRYKGAQRNALEEISLEIRPGEHIALVGPSGGGKTTLAGIIARFWDTDSGEVRIGGVDVRELSKEERMDTVSFVFQDSRLLKASIFDNVRMAKPAAGRDEVLKALRAAQCGDILEKLPLGMDTVVGANGVYLSGGEQQRISIARVMLKSAPILILDEATAFADPDNEAKVQTAFSALTQGKTVIMIAHRLSAVVRADRIYLMQNGQICESGSHGELLAQNGMYAQMWAQYGRAAQWKVGVLDA